MLDFVDRGQREDQRGQINVCLCFPPIKFYHLNAHYNKLKLIELYKHLMLLYNFYLRRKTYVRIVDKIRAQ